MDQKDIPHLKEAAAYCHHRAAMAGSEASREYWARKAVWNEDLARKLEKRSK